MVRRLRRLRRLLRAGAVLVGGARPPAQRRALGLRRGRRRAAARPGAALLANRAAGPGRAARARRRRPPGARALGVRTRGPGPTTIARPRIPGVTMLGRLMPREGNFFKLFNAHAERIV